MKTLRQLLSCSTALAILSMAVAGQTRISNPSVLVPEDVHRLFLDDQHDRDGSDPEHTYGGDLDSRDAIRRTEVHKLLAAEKITTARDFHDAAYIFQHGHEASDYLLAHILAVEAVVKGDASSKWISAASLDRYLQSVGQKQVFGTQYITRSAPSKPHTQAADSSSRTITTQEPYDKSLVSDTLRLDFCVPNLAQQATNVSEFQAGHYPTGILPSGCAR